MMMMIIIIIIIIIIETIFSNYSLNYDFIIIIELNYVVISNATTSFITIINLIAARARRPARTGKGLRGGRPALEPIDNIIL